MTDQITDPSIPAKPQALDTITLARLHYPGDTERQRWLLELIERGISSGRLTDIPFEERQIFLFNPLK